MRSFDYVFLTYWRVQGTVDEVWEILSDASSLPRWWPAVYLDVQETHCGGEQNNGVGTEFELTTRGWLPYILKWSFRVTDVDRNARLALDAFGDFTGRGVWTFHQDGDFVDIEYDWRVRADKPLLKYLSSVFKPIFQLNHRWAMQTGEKSLILEIQRRRARSQSAFDAVSYPPKPSQSEKIFAGIGILLTLFATSFITKLIRRSKS